MCNVDDWPVADVNILQHSNSRCRHSFECLNRLDISHRHISRLSVPYAYKNSSGDEIANVNFFYNIAHVEASAYAH